MILIRNFNKLLINLNVSLFFDKLKIAKVNYFILVLIIKNIKV